MEEKTGNYVEDYKELIGRLRSGNHSTFRHDLEMLAEFSGKSYKFEELHELFSDEEAVFRKFAPLEHLAQLSSENEELLRVVLQMILEPVRSNKLWNLLLHSTRSLGPELISTIREEWQRNSDAGCLRYLHMHLIDVFGNLTEEEKQHWTPIIAEREIPLWSEMMKTQSTINRGMIAHLLGVMVKQVPAKRKEVGESIISLFYDKDAISTQNQIVRALREIGDKSLLQDALFRLARVAGDPDAVKQLLSDVDVNAKDEWGKTALIYANDTGNEKIAKVLKHAGAVG